MLKIPQGDHPQHAVIRIRHQPDPRAQAARENGGKSRGPKTPEGKRRVSKNGLRHGVYSRDLILPGESANDYLALHAALESEFAPETETERDLIAVMAHARWRSLRVWCAEKTLLDNSFQDVSRYRAKDNLSVRDLTGFAFRDLANGRSPVLPLLDRTENRLERTYYRALHELRSLRRAKKHPKNEDPNPRSSMESMKANEKRNTDYWPQMNTES
jgi:hypothetical protein